MKRITKVILFGAVPIMIIVGYTAAMINCNRMHLFVKPLSDFQITMDIIAFSAAVFIITMIIGIIGISIKCLVSSKKKKPKK